MTKLNLPELVIRSWYSLASLWGNYVIVTPTRFFILNLIYSLYEVPVDCMITYIYQVFYMHQIILYYYILTTNKF